MKVIECLAYGMHGVLKIETMHLLHSVTVYGCILVITVQLRYHYTQDQKWTA